MASFVMAMKTWSSSKYITQCNTSRRFDPQCMISHFDTPESAVGNIFNIYNYFNQTEIQGND
jgi:hypothetical protein